MIMETEKSPGQLYGELRSGFKSENVFTDLTELGNIKKVELE